MFQASARLSVLALAIHSANLRRGQAARQTVIGATFDAGLSWSNHQIANQ
jgi:hypothetical protein